MSEDIKYPIYCAAHLAVHISPWCTSHQNHVSLAGASDPLVEARRRGFAFFHDDVENLRDSADNPKTGDLVGDVRRLSAGKFDARFIREIVGVSEYDYVTWKRIDGSAGGMVSKRSWRTWARGSWRCDPKGEPTRRSWSPPEIKRAATTTKRRQKRKS